ncbi:hypothetical protein ACQ5SU_001086 [Listeria monocytogenes]|uniref:hypothetical protein n=1 Tax=Listeria monocytogenes TaxID=1639 RepID=UPI000737CC03|nr:hypothetical protein [Listeria monocytogenes]EAC5748275.1 hypothetical protein [Listeria monocytogenes]EAD8585561.1 hypothetical protein [Listeria monocytogenes]EAF3671399.1 hypothetical protein [Listeria monocytogenes]EAF7392757.1 hypothetical protein [Listeria monocytogenes]EAG7273898.1 hypothetical protein [Listeria monocytogenes]
MIIENKGDYVRFLGKIRLVPGTNKIDNEHAEELEQALKHPLNKHLIESDELKVPDNLQQDSSLNDFNVTKATLLVKDTFDLGALNEFLADETTNGNRKTVIDAINKQIESISNPPQEERYVAEEDFGK